VLGDVLGIVIVGVPSSVVRLLCLCVVQVLELRALSKSSGFLAAMGLLRLYSRLLGVCPEYVREVSRPFLLDSSDFFNCWQLRSDVQISVVLVSLRLVLDEVVASRRHRQVVLVTLLCHGLHLIEVEILC